MPSHNSLPPGRTPVESAALLLLSAAYLAFEINLTRLFSVAQFYHFAFMIVSIALLGFGASGAFLAIFPGLGQRRPRQALGWLCLACCAAMLGSYLLINHLPFDSYRIAWESRQAVILAVHYLALTLPFFFGGLAVSMLLSAYPLAAGSTYAVNLVGSAVGCLLALLIPPFFGGEGVVLVSSAIAALAALACLSAPGSRLSVPRLGMALALGVLLLAAFPLAQYRLTGAYAGAWQLKLSSYKSLSYALQVPGAQVISSRWNAFSRLDRVRSSSIRSLPGLSYRYTGRLPQQDGLLVDGDNLSPLILSGQALDFAAYLPYAVAFDLRPQAEVLALEPRAGLDILAALALGARQVAAVEANPLIIESAAEIYQHPQVRVVQESGRSYTRRSVDQYDVVILSLASSYHPVNSGAYSLAEDYRYTVEAFQDILARLQPEGLLVVNRWLQTPPSESLRAFALAVTALERAGLEPGERLAAWRGYNSAVILVSRSPFTPQQLETIRQFTAARAFDLIYAPGIQPSETNQYNILPVSLYYQAFSDLLLSPDRESFYRQYPLDVRPPTDDRPFFGHFFKWSQARQVFSGLGKTWQPFGGAGYFVILALLTLACLCAAALIVLPVVVARRLRRALPAGPSPARRAATLLYFGLIGLGFMLVEIPLIQRFILLIDQPAYALALVLFSILIFSGLGSQFSPRLPLMAALAALALLMIAMPLALPRIFDAALGLPFWARLLVSLALLCPTGFLMGVPFAGGLLWMQKQPGNGAGSPGEAMIPGNLSHVDISSLAGSASSTSGPGSTDIASPASIDNSADSKGAESVVSLLSRTSPEDRAGAAEAATLAGLPNWAASSESKSSHQDSDRLFDNGYAKNEDGSKGSANSLGAASSAGAAGAAGAALIPWAWAVNGAASVVASTLAALLALSLGFLLVLQIGALCYAAAWLVVFIMERSRPAGSPGR